MRTAAIPRGKLPSEPAVARPAARLGLLAEAFRAAGEAEADPAAETAAGELEAEEAAERYLSPLGGGRRC